MPVFSASSVPNFIGLYVDKFIDPTGKISQLLVTSGGTGYSVNDLPTISVIPTGGGSGAQLEPVIVNGEIVGVNFVNDPNLGDLRGSNYNSIPTITVAGNTGTGATITCDISQNTTILGNTVNEDSLLQFCYDQGINYLLLDNLKNVNWKSSGSQNLSKPGKGLLSSFIEKARSSGITEIAAITTGSATDVDNIIDYQNFVNDSNQRFDWINFDKEYWNGDGNLSQFVSRLTYIKQQATGGTPYTLNVEIYLGIPEYADMISIIPHVDRILLDDFSSLQVPDYSYTQDRLINKIGSACTSLNKTVQLMPIFSSERIYSPWNSELEFMGNYYSSNTIYSSWYNWAISPSGFIHNNSNLGSYNNESSTEVRDYIDPVGQVIYSQSSIRTSNSPLETPFVSYISSSGPTTGLNSGETVILSANPVGYSYLWSPNSETTRDITVTGDGIFYVTVTNFSGVTSVSSAVTISFFTGNTGGTCVPIISYDGSTTFLSGGSITLSASNGYSYYWYPNGETTQNITAQTSGDYYVTVDTGTGCTGNSQYVTLNVNPCTTSIYPSGSISAITGTSILLSATTTGITYTWYPNLETGDTISVNSNGSYSVVVDNGYGCVATASTVDINFFNCLSQISYTGSTTINSGETLTLCANSADGYLWYPNGETTQCINVSSGGSYYVETQYFSGCTATSESVTVTVLNSNCFAYITASGPLYYSSGLSLSSITLTANSGATYNWFPNGETGQTITVSGSGIYSVDVDNGYGCVASSYLVVVSNSWDPVTGFWTEDYFQAVLNSNLSYEEPGEEEEFFDIPWVEYNINLTDVETVRYYAFFKLRSINGQSTGLRFAIDEIGNFVPINGLQSTTLGWYRIEIGSGGIVQFLKNETTTFFIQLNNFNCELAQFAVSSNPDFVPGPYPNYIFS